MLPVAQLSDTADTVAVGGGTLELHQLRGALHFPLKQIYEMSVIAAQQMLRLTVALLQLLLRRKPPAAYPYALTDVVVKAGARRAYVPREHLFAGGKSKRAAHRGNDVERDASGRKRSEILCLVIVPPGGYRKRGIVPGRKLDIRIALGILELYIIAGHVLLYEPVLQHQRLQLGGGMIHLESLHRIDHSPCFARRNAAGCKIA